ncbi:MAG: zinc ABC transporter substrate-binding protein, partial [Bdellovibrionales bacterium]|nr:zinc ABC transporter substrate-binding protein [Bdellovibrionales bacterium]
MCASLSAAVSAQPSEHPLHVVTTTSMIGDITRNILGERGDVVSLMGPGIDPHLFRATRSDIVQLNSADVVFYNGLFLEGKMIDALRRVESSGKKVFAVTELISRDYLLEPPEFSGHFDPHVWMDPKAWKQAVEVVRDRLADVDPQARAGYVARAAAYQQQIDALDAYAVKVMNTIPAEAKVLVTAHDAFNYFGRRFGLQVLGIQGISTESEAGVRDIERIVNVLVEKKIRAVFIESTVSDRNVRALLEGAAAQGHQVVIGGTLFSDA